MKTNELFENKSSKQLTRAEKDAKRANGRAELERQVAAAKAEKQKEFDARYNKGGPKHVKLPVIVASGRVETQEFIIDDYLEQVHKVEGLRLKDLSQAPVVKGERKLVPAYVIDITTVHPDASIPHYLHKLPRGTRRKAGFAQNDLRREAYDA